VETRLAQITATAVWSP